MNKAELLAGAALLGFEEVKNHPGANHGRYKYARWARRVSQHQWGLTEHLMIDIHYSVIAEAYYTCSIAGRRDFKSRNAENVWNWIREQLYLAQENTG